jgi:hypothetical protein
MDKVFFESLNWVGGTSFSSVYNKDMSFEHVKNIYFFNGMNKVGINFIKILYASHMLFFFSFFFFFFLIL